MLANTRRDRGIILYDLIRDNRVEQQFDKFTTCESCVTD